MLDSYGVNALHSTPNVVSQLLYITEAYLPYLWVWKWASTQSDICPFTPQMLPCPFSSSIISSSLCFTCFKWECSFNFSNYLIYLHACLLWIIHVVPIPDHRLGSSMMSDSPLVSQALCTIFKVPVKSVMEYSPFEHTTEQEHRNRPFSP